jgi:AraC-like DNA-binding protein
MELRLHTFERRPSQVSPTGIPQHHQSSRDFRPAQLACGTLHIETMLRSFEKLDVRQTSVNLNMLHVVRGCVRSVSVLLGSRHLGAQQFVNGYDITCDSCVVLDGAAEIELIAHAGSSWTLLSMRADLIGADARACMATSTSLGIGAHLMRSSTAACLALRSEALRALASNAAEFSTSRAITLALNVLQEAERVTHEAKKKTVRDMLAPRRLAVERARRYIRAHLADPIRLDDLCAHAHLQARALEYGFRELLGLPPMSYLRMLRLGAVRDQLLHVPSMARSISEIALDTGFSHLSQFVIDYKRVFGETPSTTRRRVTSSESIEPSFSGPARQVQRSQQIAHTDVPVFEPVGLATTLIP